MPVTYKNLKGFKEKIAFISLKPFKFFIM